MERLEVKRLVEDAVVEKKFVVVADVPVARVNENRGNVDSVVVVAVKWLATVSPTTESFAYGLVVPMPTLPSLLTRFDWCRRLSYPLPKLPPPEYAQL